MKTINNQTLDEFNIDARNVLEVLAKRHGLKMEGSRISYSSSDFTVKVKFELLENESGVSGAKENWKKNCEYSNLKVSMFGKTFTDRDGKFRVVGFNRKARTNVVELQNIATGKNYSCKASYLIEQLSK